MDRLLENARDRFERVIRIRSSVEFQKYRIIHKCRKFNRRQIRIILSEGFLSRCYIFAISWTLKIFFNLKISISRLPFIKLKFTNIICL